MDRKDEDSDSDRRLPNKRPSSAKKTDSSSNSDSENPPLKKQVRKKFTVFALRKEKGKAEKVSGTNSNLNNSGATRKMASESQGRQSMAGTTENESADSSSSATYSKPRSENLLAARLNRLRREYNLTKMEKKYVDLLEHCSELLALVDDIRDQIDELQRYLLVLCDMPTLPADLRRLLVLVIFFIRILFHIMEKVLTHVEEIVQRDLEPYLLPQQHRPDNNHGHASNSCDDDSTAQSDAYMGHVNYGDQFETNINEKLNINISPDDFNLDDYLDNEDNYNFDSSVFDFPTEEVSVLDIQPTVANPIYNSEPCLHFHESGGSVELCPFCLARANTKESDTDDPSKQL